MVPWRSLLLGLGALQGFVVALLLTFSRRNRTANRLLAAFLTTVSLAQMPQILGFAGAYDRYPWLTLAPFEMPWLFAPLIWLYTYRLVHGTLPAGWRWWLAPGAAQWLYYAACFLFLPLPERWRWISAFHAPLFVPAETALTLLSVAVALVLSVRRYRRYQRWLAAQVSDRENYRLAWLRNFLVGLSLALATALVFEGLNATMGLSYAGMFPMYGVLALLTYYFGIEGYRHADIELPVQPVGERAGDLADAGAEAVSPPDAKDSPDADPSAEAERDWAALAAPWVARFEEERLYLESDLTLSKLARVLATNPSTLSKAINQGLGTNFNDFVNVYRVRAVQDLLEDPAEGRSLLDVAFACGFNSKTSFNRSFRRVVGVTPSAWRAAARRAKS